MFVHRKLLGARIKAGKTILCANPEHSLFVFGNDIDNVIGQRRRIFRIVAVVGKAIPIVAAQSVVGANPDKAFAVLHDCHRRTLRHSLFCADVVKLQRRSRLSNNKCRVKNEDTSKRNEPTK